VETLYYVTVDLIGAESESLRHGASLSRQRLLLQSLYCLWYRSHVQYIRTYASLNAFVLPFLAFITTGNVHRTTR